MVLNWLKPARVCNFGRESVKPKGQENTVKFSPPLRNEFENKGIHAFHKSLGKDLLRWSLAT